MYEPRAILLDLDDTILDDSSNVTECWRAACSEFEHALEGADRALVVDAIREASRWYWGDADRHRSGRLDLARARREVVRLAFDRLGLEQRAVADGIGDAYTRLRDEGMRALPEAIDTVRWLRTTGRRLALITNGAGPAQRVKIDRFGLAELFDVILVEGELGFGKPDGRVYRAALDALDVGAEESWMVGDNLEWDVVAPQRLGVTGVWIDPRGRGMPPDAAVRPRHIIPTLSSLRTLITGEEIRSLG